MSISFFKSFITKETLLKFLTPENLYKALNKDLSSFQVKENIDLLSLKDVYNSSIRFVIDNNIATLENSLSSDLGENNLLKSIFTSIKYDSSFENISNMYTMYKSSNINVTDFLSDLPEENVKSAVSNLNSFFTCVINETKDDDFKKLINIIL